MAKTKRDGLLIAGGGLAGSLAALAMARTRPDVPILLVEEGEGFGGHHLLFFFDRDIGDADRQLADPLATHRWPGYYVAFPEQSRKLKTACSAIHPTEIDRAVRETLRPDQYRLGTRIVAVRDNELILQGGEKIKADGAIDARGAANLSMLELGWHKFLSRQYRFSGPHGLDRPVLIDATVGQNHAAGFFRCFPLTEDRMVVEEAHLSELPGLDAEDAGARIDAYIARRGWAAAELEHEATGAHPLGIGGDFAAFWRVGGARVAKLGVRGGFFHPATGYSLPDALLTASLLTEQRDFTGAALHDMFEQHSMALWRKREFYRDFNRSLFSAAPADRMTKVERVYGLDPGVIARFHGAQATMLDRRRISRL
jgi:lycopene beta-cyclase